MTATIRGLTLVTGGARAGPGVSIGHLLFTGSANVALPHFLIPTLGSASRRRWIFLGTRVPMKLRLGATVNSRRAGPQLESLKTVDQVLLQLEVLE
jgi:hypothetical protein